MAGPRFVHLVEVDGTTYSININHILLVRDHENSDLCWVRLGGSDFPFEVVGSRAEVLHRIDLAAQFG